MSSSGCQGHGTSCLGPQHGVPPSLALLEPLASRSSRTVAPAPRQAGFPQGQASLT